MGLAVFFKRQSGSMESAHREGALIEHLWAPKGKQVSPWHDIPLRAEGGLLNAIIEIPKESCPKLEVATVCSRAATTPELANRLVLERPQHTWPRLLLPLAQ